VVMFIVRWRVRRAVRRMLDTMPPEPRAVFERIRFRNLSYEEIATELAITPGEVEHLFAEGLKHMMRELGDPATQRRLAQVGKAR
jgi:DNA-directed RNA polymerase specialized sigma24 family protein